MDGFDVAPGLVASGQERPRPPPTAGQRATESQKQLLSPEHSSCAWISSPALLPEQRPGPDRVLLTPGHTLLSRLGLSSSQVRPQAGGDGCRSRRAEAGGRLWNPEEHWRGRVDPGPPGRAAMIVSSRGPPQPAALLKIALYFLGKTTPTVFVDESI
uniref:uncharacterized protein LOC103788255 n=1 Tax=Callithrix jacchus TaxID=9483 RepID=UPI0023DD1D9B|nr:uncharacterized protein LOC103788255 [Callithrix jacchus]